MPAVLLSLKFDGVKRGTQQEQKKSKRPVLTRLCNRASAAQRPSENSLNTNSALWTHRATGRLFRGRSTSQLWLFVTNTRKTGIPRPPRRSQLYSRFQASLCQNIFLISNMLLLVFTSSLCKKKEDHLKQGAHLQQLRHDGQHLWVADVYGIVPVGLLLVADVSQVEDGRQQREDPDGKQRGRGGD